MPTKKRAAKSAKPAVVNSHDKNVRVGITFRLKQLMLKHGLETKPDALVELLTKEGYTPSLVTVGTIASDFRHSIRVLQEAGRLKA